ncbi:hypothetical protein FPSE_05623 [Fusarium pseudograminearum CS3096]|uniref:Uncharacterized protein n=1 Tax=Fusarium pseudograminearum (strain CS3096) TaxID=1028729 RepID=K3VIP4_FUSPC|nr:hypothetical protein FPSE_05623 [Fusarium pseudograminearum CS3096]EKJ74184.1 hypothetical protein FPSE_05623 [Fusarium pseudograminearum CS3096]
MHTYTRTAIQLMEWGYWKGPQPYSEVEQHDACKGNRCECWPRSCATAYMSCTLHYGVPAARYTSLGAGAAVALFILYKDAHDPLLGSGERHVWNKRLLLSSEIAMGRIGLIR